MTRGCALLLAVLLISAGAPKLVAPRYAGSAVRRVVRRSQVASDDVIVGAVRGLGTVEVLLGFALLSSRGQAAVVAAAGALVTCAGLTAFVVTAVRRGSHCGCWASLSEGPAGGAELGRAVALGAMAGLLLAGRLDGHTETGVDWPAVGVMVGAVGAMVVTGLIGGRIAPVRSERVRRQLRLQEPGTAAGRMREWVAFQAGFVHAGTDRGRRRYAAARLAGAPSALAEHPRDAVRRTNAR